MYGDFSGSWTSCSRSLRTLVAKMTVRIQSRLFGEALTCYLGVNRQSDFYTLYTSSSLLIIEGVVSHGLAYTTAGLSTVLAAASLLSAAASLSAAAPTATLSAHA